VTARYLPVGLRPKAAPSYIRGKGFVNGIFRKFLGGQEECFLASYMKQAYGEPVRFVIAG